MTMTAEAWEAFVQKELADYAERIVRGSSLDFPEAHIYCRKNDETGETFTEEKPTMIVMALPNADDRGVINEIRMRTTKCDPYAVSVKLEEWSVGLPADADAALVAELAKASRERTLDKFDPKYRKEQLRVFVEAEDHPIRIFVAEIMTDAPRRLGPWEEAKVTLPRPGFKRYLPFEVREGKKTMVMRF